MPADAPALLPPNASPLECALEKVMAGAIAIDAPIETLIDPATIDAEALPFLGWALSIDRWDPDWSIERKRQGVASAIAEQRIKGTPASVKTVLASFDPLIEYIEWWEQTPRTAPFTFEVRIPIDTTGGARSTAAFAESLYADVIKVKRGSAHFQLLQMLATVGQIGVIGAARTTLAIRFDGLGATDTSEPWASFLQTEDGEPLQLEDATFLQEDDA